MVGQEPPLQLSYVLLACHLVLLCVHEESSEEPHGADEEGGEKEGERRQPLLLNTPVDDDKETDTAKDGKEGASRLVSSLSS